MTMKWSDTDKAASFTTSNDGLDAEQTQNSTWNLIRSTEARDAGKLYNEIEIVFDPGNIIIGWASASANLNSYLGSDAEGWGYGQAGIRRHAAEYSSYGTGTATGAIIMMARDANAGKAWFGKNGTWFEGGDPAAGTNPTFTGMTGMLFIAASIYNSGQNGIVRLKAEPGVFSYSPPALFTGYQAQAALHLKADGSTSAAKFSDGAIAETVYAFKAETGELVGMTTPNQETGAFDIETSASDPCMVVIAKPGYRPLTHGPITPE